jgi:hypothetical protein
MDEILGITDAEFRDAASLVYERFGIHLTDQKAPWWPAALRSACARWGCPTWARTWLWCAPTPAARN